MNRFVITLMALFMLLIAGCASNGTMSTTAAMDNGGLPEIAPYDDEPFEPLPDFVPAE